MLLHKNKWPKAVAIIALGVLCTFGHSTPTQEELLSQTAGRQDPFADTEPLAPPDIPRVASEPKTTRLMVEKPELAMETVMLRFLQAGNMQPAIKAMVTDWGNVSVDKETNSLIICDTPKQLANILEQIRRADRVPRQIQIEVVIVDVKLDDQTEIGVNWENLLGNATQGHFNSQQTLIDELGSGMDYPGASIGFIKDGIDVSLHALQTTRDVEILANPKVMVVSGQEAVIETVEEIPYVELTQSTGGVGSSDAVTSTEFKNVGLTLTVRAIITDENRIMMTIEPKQSINTGVAGVGDSTVPIVDTRRAKTTLLMDDDQVLVMGGLRKKETRITKNKVPLLGDLPLLGFLFSSDDIQEMHSELLVFISPHIRDQIPLTDYQKGRLQQSRDLPAVEIDTKPRLEHQIMQSAAEAVNNAIQPNN